MVKYQIVNPKILHGLTIDESYKEDFKFMMHWNERDWDYYTKVMVE